MTTTKLIEVLTRLGLLVVAQLWFLLTLMWYRELGTGLVLHNLTMAGATLYFATME